MGIFDKSIPKYVVKPDSTIQRISDPEVPEVYIDDIFDPLFNTKAVDYLNNKYGNRGLGILGGYAEGIDNAILGQSDKWGVLGSGMGILSGFGRSMDKADDFLIGGLTEGIKGITGQGVENPLKNIFQEDEDYTGGRLLAAMGNSMAKLAGAPELTEEDFGGLWALPATGLELATDPGILGGSLAKRFSAVPDISEKASSEILHNLGKAGGKSAVGEVGQLLSNYDDFMAKVAIDATAPGLRPALKALRNSIFTKLGNSGYHNMVDYVLDDSKITPEDIKRKTEIVENLKNDPQFMSIIEMSDSLDEVEKAMPEEVTLAKTYAAPAADVDEIRINDVLRPVRSEPQLKLKSKKLSDLRRADKIARMKEVIATDPKAVADRIAKHQMSKEARLKNLTSVTELDNKARVGKIAEFEKRLNEARKTLNTFSDIRLNTQLPKPNDIMKKLSKLTRGDTSPEGIRKYLDKYIGNPRDAENLLKASDKVIGNKEYIDKLDLSKDAIRNFRVSENEATNNAFYKAIGFPLNQTNFQHTNAPYKVAFSALRSNADSSKHVFLEEIRNSLVEHVGEPLAGKTFGSQKELQEYLNSLDIPNSDSFMKVLFASSGKSELTADQYLAAVNEASKDIIEKSYRLTGFDDAEDVTKHLLLKKGIDYESAVDDITSKLLKSSSDDIPVSFYRSRGFDAIVYDISRRTGIPEYEVANWTPSKLFKNTNLRIPAFKKSEICKVEDVARKEALEIFASGEGIDVDRKTLHLLRNAIEENPDLATADLRTIFTPDRVTRSYINTLSENGTNARHFKDIKKSKSEQALLDAISDPAQREHRQDNINLLCDYLSPVPRRGRKTELQKFIKERYDAAITQYEDYIDLLYRNNYDSKLSKELLDWAEDMQNNVLPLYNRTGKGYVIRERLTLDNLVKDSEGDASGRVVDNLSSGADRDLYGSVNNYRKLEASKHSSDAMNLNDTLNSIIRDNAELFSDRKTAEYVLEPLKDYYDILSVDGTSVFDKASDYSRYTIGTVKLKDLDTVKNNIKNKLIPAIRKDIGGGYDPWNPKSSTRKLLKDELKDEVYTNVFNKVVKDRKWSYNNYRKTMQNAADAIPLKETFNKAKEIVKEYTSEPIGFEDVVELQHMFKDKGYNFVSTNPVKNLNAPVNKLTAIDLYAENEEQLANMFSGKIPSRAKYEEIFNSFINRNRNTANFIKPSDTLNFNKMSFGEALRTMKAFGADRLSVNADDLFKSRRYLGHIDPLEVENILSGKEDAFLQQLSKPEWRTPIAAESNIAVGNYILKGSADISGYTSRLKDSIASNATDKMAERVMNTLPEKDFEDLISSSNVSAQTFVSSAALQNIVDEISKSKFDKLHENTISHFKDENHFLSNFANSPVTIDGVTYSSAETAFQLQKIINPEVRKANAMLSPVEARKLGSSVELRPDWENVKDDLMTQIVKAKFEQNPEFAQKLLATGDTYLEEGNDWGDKYWGIVDGIGENKLGKILMDVRGDLKSEAMNIPVKKPYKGLNISTKKVPSDSSELIDEIRKTSPPPESPSSPPPGDYDADLPSQKRTWFEIAKQEVSAVQANKTSNKAMRRRYSGDEGLAKEFMGKTPEQAEYGKRILGDYIAFSDRTTGDTLQGKNMLSELLTSGGKLVVSLPKNSKNLDALTKSVKHNIGVINDAAGAEVLVPVFHKSKDGYVTLGLSLNTKMLNSKVVWTKNAKKILASQDNLQDMVFQTAKDMGDTGRICTSNPAKFNDAARIFRNVRENSKDYLTKLGYKGEMSDTYINHAFTDTVDAGRFLADEVYGKNLNVQDCEDLANTLNRIDGFRQITHGTFGSVFASRSLRGSIDLYNRQVPVFSTDAREIVRSSYTKGMMANSKMQTFVDLFNNKNFCLNEYFKTPEEVEKFLYAEDSTGNFDNISLVTPVYDSDGQLKKLHRFDKSTREGIAEALKDPDTIFVPTNVIAPLDSVLKKEIQMSSAAYRAFSKMTLPFKFGVLANPGFLLGNGGDATLKQATTMAQKYGTSVPEELANVAVSLRQVHTLNNKFDSAYRKYLADLKLAGFNISVSDNISTNIVNNSEANLRFRQYLDGCVEDKHKHLALCSLSNKERKMCRTWLYINTHQATETAASNLLDMGDLVSSANKSKYDIPTNVLERVAYGSGKYSKNDFTTWGLFMNNPICKGVIDTSEEMETYFRSAAVLNDLRHRGLDVQKLDDLLNTPNLAFDDIAPEKGSFAKMREDLEIYMQDAINAMNHSNFSYEDKTDFVNKCSYVLPFPTFFLKNFGYWLEKFIENPQYVKRTVKVQNGLWTGKDTENDSFLAEAKGRGAVPMPKVHGLPNLFKGIYKPAPLSSMFSAFSLLNNPVEDIYQRTNPLISGGSRLLSKALPSDILTASNVLEPDSVRYRPYNTNVYQKNINKKDSEFNPLTYTLHKANPYDRAINTGLRLPGKLNSNSAQLSDFLPSVFQPDFGKK